jgi:hypothetical protein
MEGIDWANVATLNEQLGPGKHTFGSGQVDDEVAEWEALEAMQLRADERIEDARKGTAHLPPGFRLVVSVPGSGEAKNQRFAPISTRCVFVPTMRTTSVCGRV